MDSLLSDYAKKIELEGKSSRASKAELESLETKILETSTIAYNSKRENEPLELKGATLEQFRLDVEAGVKAEIAKKNAAIEEAAEAKKVKAKAAREEKAAEKAEKEAREKEAAEAKAKAAKEDEAATKAAEAKAKAAKDAEEATKAAKEKEAATKAAEAATKAAEAATKAAEAKAKAAKEAEKAEKEAREKEAAEAKAKAAKEKEAATKAAEAKAKAARDASRRPPLSPTSRRSTSRRSSPPLSPTSPQPSPPLSPTSPQPSPPLSPTTPQPSPPLTPASERIKPSNEQNDIDELVRKLREGLRISDTLQVHVDKDTGSQLRDTQRIVCCKKGVGNNVIVGDFEYMNAPIYRIRHDIEPGNSPNLMDWRREHTLNPITKEHWRVKDVSDILAIAIDVPLDYENLPEERVRLLLSKEEKRKLAAEKKKIPKQPDVQVFLEWEVGVRNHDGNEQFTSWESRAGCHKIWKSNADDRINEWAQAFEDWYRKVGGSNGTEQSPMPRIKLENTEESESAAKAAAAKAAAIKAAAEEAAAKEAAEKEAASEKAAAEKDAAEKAAKDAAASLDANHKQELKKKKAEQEFIYRDTLDIPEDRPLTMDEKMGLAQMILKSTA